jgi:muramoyltetrapeptide carboxypeptidase
MTQSSLRVGVFAPSSVVPGVEFDQGVRHLRGLGFDVAVHGQTLNESFTFAGTDEDRAAALYEHAMNPDVDIVWAARGGYGAQRLLPILDRLTSQRGQPRPKLLIGYSDVTVLHEYVRRAWGWQTLHAPMPSAGNFARLKDDEWKNLVALARRQHVDYPASEQGVTWMSEPPRQPITGQLVGGNLSLWQSLTGTPWAPTRGRDRILFFEDIGEALYRIDRMVTQISQAGLLDGAAAVVLGDFTDCEDENNTKLKPCEGDALKAAIENPKEAERVPLRRTYTQAEGLEQIFGTVCRRLGIPLAKGFPVGHGPNFYPLPLGARYELSPAGQLKMIDWAWTQPFSTAKAK